MVKLLGLNKDAVKKIIEDLGVQSAVDKIPSDMKEDIQPVLDMAPRRYTTIVKTYGGGASTETLYTTPSSKRKFYLTGWSISLTESVDVGTENYIEATLEDGSTVVIGAATGGATAGVTIGTGNHGHTFHVPVPLKAGTAITFTCAGDLNRAIIYGYEIDTP